MCLALQKFGTCGFSCTPGGYCNPSDGGSVDPQCAVACSNCSVCTAAMTPVVAMFSSINSSMDPASYGLDYARQLYKTCMGSSAAAAVPVPKGGDLQQPVPGKCMGAQVARCSASAYTPCQEIDGCWSKASCRKVDPATCDAGARDKAGEKCRVSEYVNGRPCSLGSTQHCYHCNAC